MNESYEISKLMELLSTFSLKAFIISMVIYVMIAGKDKRRKEREKET